MGPELIRQIESDNRSNRNWLVDQMRDECPGVTPFVGAGMSRPFGFPGWSGFLVSVAIKAGIEEQVKQQIDRGEYEEAAEACLDSMGRTAFQDEIKREFGDDKLELETIEGPVELIPRFTKGPVVTTNFDHVLEQVFQRGNKRFEKVVLGTQGALVVEAFHCNRRYLLKIHGDVDDPDNRVLTVDEYARHYGSAETSRVKTELPLPKALQLIMLNRPLLFLGCSLSQDRTIAVLKQVCGSYAVIHYAIVEQPSSDEGFRRRAAYLSKNGIRPIWYPQGRHDQIKAILEDVLERAGKPPVRMAEAEQKRSVASLAGVSNPAQEIKRLVYEHQRHGGTSTVLNIGLDFALVWQHMKDIITYDTSLKKLRWRSLMIDPDSPAIAEVSSDAVSTKTATRVQEDIRVTCSAHRERLGQREIDLEFGSYRIVPPFQGFLVNQEVLLLRLCEIKESKLVGRLISEEYPYWQFQRDAGGPVAAHFVEVFEDWFEYLWATSRAVWPV